VSRVTIVGLGGSLAPHSTSLSALSVALDGARDYGADVRLFDLRELNLPMFIPDTDPTPVRWGARSVSSICPSRRDLHCREDAGEAMAERRADLHLRVFRSDGRPPTRRVVVLSTHTPFWQGG
jgi:hypothetical protein